MEDLPSAVTGRRTSFWQFNIGHVITIMVFLVGIIEKDGTMLATFVAHFAALETQVAALKNDIGDIREWREEQVQENREWRQSVNSTFDDLKRHMERLDAAVESRPVNSPPPPAPQRYQPPFHHR